MSRKILHIILTCFIAVISVSVAPVISAEIPQAKTDKGLVVFYRDKQFKGGAIRFTINHSEGSLGQLLNGTFLYKYFDPGSHTFSAQAVSQDSITLEVEAGKVYYVKGDVRMGVYAGRPKFTRISESSALSDLEKLK